MVTLRKVAIIGGIFALGSIAGIAVSNYTHKKKTSYCGNLRIDRSQEGAPMIFLELNQDLSVLLKSKDVVLKVIDKNYVA